MSPDSDRSFAFGASGEVSGVFLYAIPESLRRACGSCHTIVSAILEAKGVADPDPAQWYDIDDCLAVYGRIEAEIGRYTLFRIGRGLARAMDWPGSIASIDDALPALAGQYDRHHRGYDDWSIGHRTERRGIGTITFETSYPTVMEAGLVRGVDDRFGHEETFLSVRQGPTDETITVRWWDEGIDHVERIVPSWTSGDDLDRDLLGASRVGTPVSR